MTKSCDSGCLDRSLLSIYQEKGRSKRITNNTPTKIYAPNGTFESKIFFNKMYIHFLLPCRDLNNEY